MKLCFFRVAVGDEAAENELNRFLASHRIVSVDRDFYVHQGVGAWAVCVTAEESGSRRPVAGQEKGRVDWKEVLPPDQFAAYSELRSLRKELAEGEGVAVYNVMTNAQLAEIVRRKTVDVEALRDIPGLGEARVNKYGERFVQFMLELAPALEASTPPAEGAASGDGAEAQGSGATERKRKGPSEQSAAEGDAPAS